MTLQEHFLRGFEKQANLYPGMIAGEQSRVSPQRIAEIQNSIQAGATNSMNNFNHNQEQQLDHGNIQRKFQAGGDYSMDMGAGERFAKQQMADLHPASAARMAMHGVENKINDHSGFDLASGAYNGQSQATDFTSHITDNGRSVSGIGANGNIQYGQPSTPQNATGGTSSFSFGAGSNHPSLSTPSIPSTPKSNVGPTVQTSGINSSLQPTTNAQASNRLNGGLPQSHFSPSPSSVSPMSAPTIQRQQPLQNSSVQPSRLGRAGSIQGAHLSSASPLQTSQLQPAHSLGSPAGLGHLHR